VLLGGEERLVSSDGFWTVRIKSCHTDSLDLIGAVGFDRTVQGDSSFIKSEPLILHPMSAIAYRFILSVVRSRRSFSNQTARN
jgi:hypothetical protein